MSLGGPRLLELLGGRALGGWERGTPTGRDSPRPSPPLAPPAASFQLPTGPLPSAFTINW